MSGTGITVLKSAASLASFITYASPTPMMYQIARNQSTGEKSHFPLVAMLANCELWMMYWFLKHSIFPIAITMVAGVLFSIVYIGIFIKYTTQRPLVLKTVAVVAFILAAVSVYVTMGAYGRVGLSKSQVTMHLGYISDLASVCFFASPMERIKRVVQIKSNAPIPIQLCLMGSVMNALWASYGILTHNWFVVTPNSLSLTFNAVQLTLYVVYWPHTSSLDTLERGCEELTPAYSVVLSPKLMTVNENIKTAMDSPQFHTMRSPLTRLNSWSLAPVREE